MRKIWIIFLFALCTHLGIAEQIATTETFDRMFPGSALENNYRGENINNSEYENEVVFANQEIYNHALSFNSTEDTRATDNILSENNSGEISLLSELIDKNMNFQHSLNTESLEINSLGNLQNAKGDKAPELTEEATAYTLTIEDVTVENGVITSYTSSETEIVIPKELGGQTITSIGTGAFEKKGIKKVHIPNTVRRLEGGSFNDCPIEEMTFEENSSLMFLGTYTIGRNQVNGVPLPTDFPVDCNSSSSWMKKQPGRGSYAGLDAFIEDGDRAFEFYRSVMKAGEYTLTADDVEFADGVIISTKLTDGRAIYETIKIPNEINGEAVRELGKASFWFVGAKTFIIPASLQVIKGGAIEWVGLENVVFEEKSALHTIESYGFSNVILGSNPDWSFNLPTDCPEEHTATTWSKPTYNASSYTGASAREITPNVYYTYTISFQTLHAEAPESISFMSHQIIEELPVLTDERNEFLGWLYNGELIANQDIATILPEEDAELILQAKWEAKPVYTYTVNFDMAQYGDAIEDIIFDNFTTEIPLLPTPTDNTMNFLAWFDADGNELTTLKGVFDSYEEDFTLILTASWEKKPDGYTLKPEDVDITAGGVITAYHPIFATDTKIVIPKEFEVDGTTIEVKALGYQLFYENAEITEVIMPSTLKVIGERAFREMSALTTVVIPASVEIIGAKAFNKSTNITSFTFEPKSALYSVGLYDGDPSHSDWPRKHADSYYEVFNGLTCEIKLPLDFPDTYTSASQWSNVTDGVVIAEGGNGDAVKMNSFNRELSAVRPDVEPEAQVPYGYVLVDADVVVEDGVVVSYAYAGEGNAPTEITIPNELHGQTIIALGAGSFQSKSLTRAVLPTTLKRLEANALKGNLLTDVYIPASVQYIGGGALDGIGDDAVNSITFAQNSSLREVANWAFGRGDYNLPLPNDYPSNADGATSWYQDSQINNTGNGIDADQSYGGGERNSIFIRNVYFNDKYTLLLSDVTISGDTIISYNFPGGVHPANIIIPGVIGGTKVNVIGADSFRRKALGNVTIGAGIATIEPNAFKINAFEESDGAVSFETGSMLSHVGSYAFSYNNTTVNLPQDFPVGATNSTLWIRDNGSSRGNDSEVVEVDRSYSYYRVVQTDEEYVLTAKDVTIDESGVIASYYYSGGYIRPYSIVIPDKIGDVELTGVGANVFSYQGIRKLIISETIEAIETYAFAFNALESVIFEPNSSLVSVGTYAFGFNLGTAEQLQVELPQDFPAIASSASPWISSLDGTESEDAVIVEEDRAKSFGRNISFEYNLTADDLIIENDIIVGINYNGTNKSFIIPDDLGIKGIASGVFKDMGLIGIKFPESLKFIADSAFEGNELYNLIIPANVDSIGENAFANNAINLKIVLPTVQEGNEETDYYWIYKETEVVEIAQYIDSNNWERAVERKIGKRERNPGWTRDMEKLKRGIVAINTGNGIFVSWRLLGTDSPSVKFNLYRDGVKLNSEPMDLTNYTDAEGTVSSEYKVVTVLSGEESTDEWLNSKEVKAWSKQGLKMKLDRPAGGVALNGEAYSYTPNDASVADLDGDGEYELVIKWEPSLFSTNMPGMSGNCIIDAYEFDGTEETPATRLWRIDFGINVKAGSHYNAFMVYDLDGDGKAELVAKTAPGTIDGKGNFVSREKTDPNYNSEYDDPTKDYRSADGTVNRGPEYLTLFDGKTGAELHTITYNPSRHPDTMSPTAEQQTEVWGDSWNNRGDRFLGAIAYLDGEKPSVVMTRGIYTRVCLAAYDVVDQRLVERWFHDSGYGEEKLASFGQGYHALTVGDVDSDGRDEIVYGACTIDDDGALLATTGQGHGDALHLTDADPDRPGLEAWAVHEDTNADYGYDLWDPATGNVIFGEKTRSDNGRGLLADIDPNYRGKEMWSVANQNLFNCKGDVIAQYDFFSRGMINYRVYWDGDLQDELFNRNVIDKWNPETKVLDRKTTLYSINGGEGNNGTKYNPCLQADIYGDWREEIILRGGDDAIVIYSTTDPTEHRLFTLMHDPQYRLAVAWQNVGYNQPPHLSFYIGDGVEDIPMPDIVTNEYDGKVKLEYAVAPEESGTIVCDYESGVLLDEGTEVTLLYKGEEGYQFLGWYNHNQLVSKDATLQMKLEIDSRLEARIEKVYKLEYRSNYDGEETAGEFEVAIVEHNEATSYTQAIKDGIAINSGEYYRLNTYVGAKFKPNVGFEFKGWFSQGGKRLTERDSVFVTLMSDTVIVAQVEKLEMVNYSYTINDQKSGIITSSVDAGFVVNGAEVSLSFIPNEGYVFGGWYANGILISEELEATFTIREDIEIEGRGLQLFKFTHENETEIAGTAYSSHENGALIAATKPVKIIYTLTDGLYSFEGWYVDGNKVSQKTTYEFNMNEDIHLVSKVTKRFTDGEKQIKVYPNPASDFIVIETPEASGVVRIFSSNGVLVKVERLINSKSRINVSDLNSGAYVIHTEDGEKQTIIIK